MQKLHQQTEQKPSVDTGLRGSDIITATLHTPNQSKDRNYPYFAAIKRLLWKWVRRIRPLLSPDAVLPSSKSYPLLRLTEKMTDMCLYPSSAISHRKPPKLLSYRNDSELGGTMNKYFYKFSYNYLNLIAICHPLIYLSYFVPSPKEEWRQQFFSTFLSDCLAPKCQDDLRQLLCPPVQPLARGKTHLHRTLAV